MRPILFGSLHHCRIPIAVDYLAGLYDEGNRAAQLGQSLPLVLSLLNKPLNPVRSS
jgi:hypothetical protein